MSEWPLSNYPVLMALILMVAVAIELMLGESEAYANQLVIFAYFLLVIGAAVRFFELTLPGALFQVLRVKMLWNKSRDILKNRKESKSGFFVEVTRNVFFSLMFFFLIAVGYGALVDWFFVGRFIKQLGYVTVIFFVLHMISRVRL